MIGTSIDGSKKQTLFSISVANVWQRSVNIYRSSLMRFTFVCGIYYDAQNKQHITVSQDVNSTVGGFSPTKLDANTGNTVPFGDIFAPLPYRFVTCAFGETQNLIFCAFDMDEATNFDVFVIDTSTGKLKAKWIVEDRPTQFAFSPFFYLP